MSKNKRYIINRKQYDKVRKMDHCQMTLWVESIYKSGYEQGKKDAEGLTIDEVKSAILGVKGIGEKKAVAIIETIEAKLAGAKDIEETE